MADRYRGLVRSYLIEDIRPVEYWNVQTKPSRAWVSCTRHTSKAKADRDLASTRHWIASEPRTNRKVFRIVARVEFSQ